MLLFGGDPAATLADIVGIPNQTHIRLRVLPVHPFRSQLAQMMLVILM